MRIDNYLISINIQHVFRQVCDIRTNNTISKVQLKYLACTLYCTFGDNIHLTSTGKVMNHKAPTYQA